MAYVPDYSHDVFVSYAHVDDEPLPGEQVGWVTTLVQGLKTTLKWKLGRGDEHSIWMDNRLSRHVDLTSQIMDTLHKTATMLVVLSPGYVESQWCEREKATFLRFVGERIRSGSRVFVIERDKVPKGKRPPEFGDLVGYPFWVEDREGRPPRILGLPGRANGEPRYYDVLNDLCHELAEELRRLKELGPSAVPLVRDAPTIFLAHVTDDLDHLRDDVRRYLQQCGIRVLPDKWYSFDPATYADCVRNDLSQSSAFVQLLSEVPGKRPPQLPQGYAHLQYSLARSAGKRLLQWRRPELSLRSVEDRVQRELLELSTVHGECLEDFKAEVKRTVFAPPEDRRSPRPQAFVFVDMETDDRGLAEAVCEVLDQQKVEYALPILTGSPEENRRDLEQNLLTCDGVIVVYGKSTVGWVREQLRQCRKIVASRDRPLQALAVYEGPPEEKPPLDLKLQNLRIINCRRGVSAGELVAFLQGIGAGV